MTIKTKSQRLRRLLSHGYFAPELPPCFVSEDLARYRKSISDGILDLPKIKQQPNFHRYITEPATFYFPRFGKDDRKHSVPNPLSYLMLAKVVADNYVRLRRAAKRSGLSASPPVFDWSGPRAVMRPSVDLRDDFRIDLSSRREEYAAADVRAFFHSIYTHSIPWAIYGKAWAKKPANRGIEHFGNLIDLLCRNQQDGQTIGLPVGPDTSRLLAEVVASAMDEMLRNRLGISGQDASRYIDDYTISSAKSVPGANLIAALRQAVAHFELELNTEKSAVISTSARHNTGWKQAVRSCIPQGQRPSSDGMQRFFYEIGQLCAAHPDINVEKFAFTSARLAFVRADKWKSIQSMLINAYRRNSTLVSFLVEITLLRNIERGDVDTINLTDFLNHRLPALARANRTGEIIWFLFLAVRLRLVLSLDAVSELFEMLNPMVALLVTAADAQQLIRGPVNYDIWNAAHSSEGLTSPMWLYAYETAHKNMVPGINSDFLQNDTYFSLLKAKNVSFFDVGKGFESMAGTMRALRNDNERIRRVREDFLEDFDVDIEDVDDEDDDQHEHEYEGEY